MFSIKSFFQVKIVSLKHNQSILLLSNKNKMKIFFIGLITQKKKKKNFFFLV